MAELVDALDSGSSGFPWGFESPQLHHIRHRNRYGKVSYAGAFFIVFKGVHKGIGHSFPYIFLEFDHLLTKLYRFLVEVGFRFSL